MAQILALSEKDFRIIMINMLKDLMEKVDNMHEQIRNFSKEMEAEKWKMGNIRNIKHVIRDEFRVSLTG